MDLENAVVNAIMNHDPRFDRIGLTSKNINSVFIKTFDVSKHSSFSMKEIHNVTPFVAAILTGDKSVVSAIMDLGADLTMKVSGRSPIHYAVKVGYPWIVEEIVKRNPKVVNDRTETTGGTILHLHFQAPCEDALFQYLKAGCDPNIRNNNGNTAMHIAASHDLADDLLMLVRFGADLTIANDEGKTVKDIAQEHKAVRVLQFLEQYEANPEKWMCKPGDASSPNVIPFVPKCTKEELLKDKKKLREYIKALEQRAASLEAIIGSKQTTGK